MYRGASVSAPTQTTVETAPPPYTDAEIRALGLDPGRLPRHIAIIMDGNGRWAQRKGWMRIRGHEEGARSVRIITEECARLGMKQITLYAFSSENWKRPEHEVGFLMKLLCEYLEKERPVLLRNNIRFSTIGDISKLPQESRRILDETFAACSRNTGLVLCLALNYGGRQEIVEAARRLAREAKDGRIAPEEIDEALFASRLSQPEMPELDLLIRTAGEYRVSNFLLWQVSYAELWSTPVLWPEFRAKDLLEGLREFSRRTRKFGGILG